jgi:hypothetical protein
MKKAAFCILLLAFIKGYSQTIFQDNLNNYTVNTQLSGQGTWTNNSSNGGTGACTGALCVNAKVLTPGFNYLNYGSSTKSLQLLSDTDGCGTLFTPVTSGDVYVGFMINVSSAATNPNDFFRVNNGSFTTTTFRVFVKTVSGNTYTLGISKGAPGNATVYTTNVYSFNQDYLVILKYSQLAGAADDQLNLYVNPVMANGIPTTPDATTNSGTDQSGNLDRLVFRQNTTVATTPTGRAGLVSVARSWTGLIFPNMAASTFSKAHFTINTKNAKNGVLQINALETIEKATLSIYNLEGKLVENKSITLLNTTNDIGIHPIANEGVYLVSIEANGEQYSQKVMVN